MRKNSIGEKLGRWWRFFYLKLFRINDSPQRIAIGFGLGVFLGVLPGTGPIAAFFVSVLLRVNRVSAVLGSLLTNTWISLVAFMAAIRVGAFVVRADWQNVRAAYLQVIKDFHWAGLFKVSVLKVLAPIVVGYFVVALCFAVLAYLLVLILVIKAQAKMRAARIRPSHHKRMSEK